MNVYTEFNINDFYFILRSAGVTLGLCLGAMTAGSALGLVVGVMRTSRFSFFVAFSWLYVYFIRGTPLLIQLFLIYYGIPMFLGIDVPPLAAALWGLSLYTAAYMGEIVRAGIQSVDIGQKEAAKALGMTRFQEFRHIVFPQALRLIVYPAFGFFIALIKDSSLVSIIGFVELARSGRLINARTQQPLIVYFLIAVVYFVICYGLSRMSRGRVFNKSEVSGT